MSRWELITRVLAVRTALAAERPLSMPYSTNETRNARAAKLALAVWPPTGLLIGFSTSTSKAKAYLEKVAPRWNDIQNDATDKNKLAAK
jgi:hypothetical protein